MSYNSMDEANNLLTVCAEFEVIAAATPHNGHIKLIMRDLFDTSAIQRLYNGGGMAEDYAISMLERQCKWAREELKMAVEKVKKKTKSVVGPIPAQYDGMKQNGNPIGDIAKLNSQINSFEKTAKLDDMLLKRIDNASGLAKEVFEYALAYKKSPEHAQKQYGTEMLHLVAGRILEDLDLIRSDVKEAMREIEQSKPRFLPENQY